MTRVYHLGRSTIQWSDRDPMPVPVGCERREIISGAAAREREYASEYRAAIDRLNGSESRSGSPVVAVGAAFLAGMLP